MLGFTVNNLGARTRGKVVQKIEKCFKTYILVLALLIESYEIIIELFPHGQDSQGGRAVY